MILAFSKTTQQLLTGHKSVTRRFWADSYVAKWQSEYDKGFKLHTAYDKSPRNGGKLVGWIRLTERPYREPLSMLTESELLAEGGMCKTIGDFCDLVGKKPEDVAVVVRFQFLPLAEYAGSDWLKSCYPDVEVSPLGERAADFLGLLFLGLYHLGNKRVRQTDWSRPDFFEIKLEKQLATYDFNELTRIVFLSHEMLLRVSIENTRGGLRMMLHSRKNESAHRWEQMPTIDEHIERLRCHYSTQ